MSIPQISVPFSVEGDLKLAAVSPEALSGCEPTITQQVAAIFHSRQIPQQKPSALAKQIKVVQKEEEIKESKGSDSRRRKVLCIFSSSDDSRAEGHKADEATINACMKLKITNPPLQVISPGKNGMPFNKEEMVYIESCFSKWALCDGICLLELLGVDLFDKFSSLIQKMKTDSSIYVKIAATKLNEEVADFCMRFIIGYISFIRYLKIENFYKERCFIDAGVGRIERSRGRHYLTPARWSNFFYKTKEGYREKLAACRVQRPYFKEHIKAIDAGLDFGGRVIPLPEASVYLIDSTLYGLQKEFPTAWLLNKLDSSQTLRDLTTYVHFINKCWEECMKKENLSVKATFLSELEREIAIFSASQDKFQAVNVLKKKLGKSFSVLKREENILKEQILNAQQGVLSHSDLFRTRPGEVSQELFLIQLNFSLIQIKVLSAFYHDFFNIIDEQVMEISYPDVYVTTAARRNRFNIVLNCLFKSTENPDLKAAELERSSAAKNEKAYHLVSIPNTLSSVQQEQLQRIFFAIKKNISSVVQAALAHPCFKKARQSWVALNQNADTVINQGEWICFFKTLNPILEEEGPLLAKLAEVEKEHLSLIKEFFKSFQMEDLYAQREFWVVFFKDLVWKESADLSRFMLMIADLKIFLTFDEDAVVSDLDENVFSWEFIQWMEVYGCRRMIQEVFEEEREKGPSESRSHFPKPPTPTVLTPQGEQSAADAKGEVKPPSLKNLKLAAQQATVRVSSTPARIEKEDFTMRRGEKVRKFLQRLRDTGILLDVARQKGSHQTVHVADIKNEGSIHSVTIPRKSHLKPGTAKSLAEQLSQAFNGNSPF